MKKILSIMAVAALVLGFTACNEGGKNNPDQTKVTFAIKALDVTATSANVVVTPSDTNIYYYFDILTADVLESGYNADSLAAEMKASVEADGKQFPYYLSKGEDNWEYSGLSPETEYTVYALQLDSNYNKVADWTLYKFTTSELVITETVEVNAQGELIDYAAAMGLFQVYADIDESGAYLQLTIAADDIEGTFTDDNLEDYFGSWVVITEEDYYPVVSINLTGVLSTNGEAYKLEGEVIGANGVRYNVQITCPVEAEEGAGAPARIARKVAKRF